MKKQLYGDELVLSILEKELASATKKAAKAKADCEAAMYAYSAIIKVRAEAHELIKDGMRDMPKEKLAKLNVLASKEKNLIALTKRDSIKLMDAEFESKSVVDELNRIIAQMKCRAHLRKGNAA